MKKTCVLIILFFIVVFLTSCSPSVDFTILDEESVTAMTEVSTYVNELQSSKTDYKGYKVFDASDGNKIVVISSGEPTNALNVHKVEQSSKDTGITIVKTDLPSEQTNPYVAVKLEKIVGALLVFERVPYEGT